MNKRRISGENQSSFRLEAAASLVLAILIEKFGGERFNRSQYQEVVREAKLAKHGQDIFDLLIKDGVMVSGWQNLLLTQQAEPWLREQEKIKKFLPGSTD